jgi:uncharacterized NAD(P)/FAD-binding protein YdhS
MASTVVVIGGGFSGTMTAVHLSRMAINPLRIFLINSRNPFAKGIAYSTPFNFHLLNVKAARMSAFPDEPDDFVDWLNKTGEYQTADKDWVKKQFIPRKIYGRYLAEILDKEIKERNNIQLVNEEVVDIEHNINDSITVFLSNESALYADKVALALGNFLPTHPFSQSNDFIRSRYYIHDPWRIQFNEFYSASLPVLLVGSGLTMIDIFLNLQQINYNGKIYVLSRNGLLPAPHSIGEKFTFDDDVLNYSRLNELYPLIKRNLKKAYESGDNLDGALDIIRKNIKHLWQHLTLNDKKQFLRHVSSKWNIVRHRIPKEIYNKVAEAIKKGQIEILKGRLEEAEAGENVAMVKYKTSTGELKVIKAVKVINCMGPMIDYLRIDSLLVKNLIRRQYIQPHELKLGIEAKADGTVLQPGGKPSEFLFVIGNALTGILWESVAVPELRQQAKTIAQNIIHQLSYEEAVIKHH